MEAKRPAVEKCKEVMYRVMNAASFMAQANSRSAKGLVTTKDTDAASDFERTGAETSMTSDPTMCWNEKLAPSP